MPRFEIAAFYKFLPLPGFKALRGALQACCDQEGIKGILLLAPEGINGTLAGPPERLAAALDCIRALAGTGDLSIKTSHADTLPFLRMKVRLKAEIVTMGDPGVEPHRRTGTEVEPEDWNELISDPDITVIDVRNGFEVAIGSFAGAIDPGTTSFSDFPAFVRSRLDPARHRRIAMFCTGGIRCEKASSLMLGEGFETVFQLKGGILSYLERVPRDESLWDGACFVFDGRVAVGHGLAVADVSTCFGCRNPLTAGDRASPTFEDGVSCPHCEGLLSTEQKASARERHRQVCLAAEHGRDHLGTDAQPPRLKQALKAVREPRRLSPAEDATTAHRGPYGARDGSRNGSR